MPTNCVRLASLWVLPGLVLALAASPSNADELVLRNLKVVRNCQITSVDIDGVRVDRDIEGVGKSLSWDLILKASLTTPDAEKSAAIKEFSQSIGAPLTRLKSRMLVGDNVGQLEPAEALHAVVQGRPTRDNLLALIGLMRGSIAHGRREHAVPFAIEAIRLRNASKIPFSIVPGKPPAVDPQSGLFEELPAIWLDVDAAKAVWPAAEKLAEKQLSEAAGTADSDAVFLYAASLAIAVGDATKGESLLAHVTNKQSSAAGLVQVELNLASDRVAQAAQWLEAAPTVPPFAQPWLALVRARFTLRLGKAEEDHSAVLLDLLRVPALHAGDQSELAAGALEQAIAIATLAGDSKMAQTFKSELQRAFPETVAARRAPK